MGEGWGILRVNRRRLDRAGHEGMEDFKRCRGHELIVRVFTM